MDGKTETKKVYTGTVVWFAPDKGIGFIKRDDGEKDIFVHYSDIVMNGYKVVMAGDKVSFEESYSFKDKLKASNVTILQKKRDMKKKNDK